MKIVLAFDSFKHCMRAHEVCDCVRSGIFDAVPEAEILPFPLADGGEGTVDAACRIAGKAPVCLPVTGPLGERRSAPVLLDGDLAILETASACGIEWVPPEDRDPMRTTTFGVGELLKEIAARGVRKCVIGLGGSATVDGGIGMLRALGARFFDTSGRETDSLIRVAGMDFAIDLPEMEMLLASDVENPLCGPCGAAAVFGPQKGAKEEDIPVLDHALKHLQTLFGAEDLPGDGAAGGLGFAFRMLGARRTSGARWMLQYAGFAGALQNADLVITGEGRSDGQTADGKLPWIVAEEAARCGVPAVLLSGALGAGYEVLQRRFIALSSLSAGPGTLEEALQDAPRQLRRQGRNLANLLSAGIFRR
ncbi:MAG: glycerate kinase [Lentisphaeria bacterium]|nr:glycerate kinase [Lentisphaeria bacterium]